MATLFVVATPIGNLEDLTIRAINVLSNVDFILCEDTRVTRVLLERYHIKTQVISYHQHSGLGKVRQILDLLEEGKDLALVTDAGTPGINDPGGKLIETVSAELPEVKIVPIPGPNAALAALSVSGMPTDRFTFLGFPPHKKGRQTFFKRIAEIEHTVVFYESKHRIMKALEQLRELAHIEQRKILVAREITKQFETMYRGTLEEIIAALTAKDPLGEFVVVIGPIGRSREINEE